MQRRLIIGLLLMLPVVGLTQERKPAAKTGTEPKTLSGISIVGNHEAPKSLYIVPWKGSELGDEHGLRPDLLDARAAPVDREVLLREVNYYELRSPR
jgi:hypothetical protein